MLPSINGSQNCNPPVSSPWAQGRGRWCLTSQGGLAGSGRPPRRGCRPPPGRAGGSQGSTRWGCSLNTFVLTTTREGRTLEFLRQLDFRTFRLITFSFHVLSSFLVKLCCIILAAKVFQYLFLLVIIANQLRDAKHRQTDLLCKAKPLKQRPSLQRFSIQSSPLQTNIGEEKGEEGVILHLISDYIVKLDVIQWEMLHCL